MNVPIVTVPTVTVPTVWSQGVVLPLSIGKTKTVAPAPTPTPSSLYTYLTSGGSPGGGGSGAAQAVKPAVLKAAAERDAFLNPPTATASEITAGPSGISMWKMGAFVVVAAAGIGAALYFAGRKRKR